MVSEAILAPALRLSRRDGLGESEVSRMVNRAALKIAMDAGDARRTQAVGTRKGAHILGDLHKMLHRVASELDNLPAEAYGALDVALKSIQDRRSEHERQGVFSIEDRPQHPYAHAMSARALAGAVERAQASLNAGPATKAGRPRKLLAMRVRHIAGHLFEEITGRPGKVTTNSVAVGHPAEGAFVDFIAEVFSALGIGASAGSQAKR
jgi:hypothetical protein